MMNLHILPDTDALIQAYVGYLAGHIEAAIMDHDSCSLVLTGGNSPKGAYRLLTQSPWRDQVDWSKVTFFFGDERYVPPDHERNNARMATTILLDPLGIPASRIHRINTKLSPEESAKEYAVTIQRYFHNQPAAFDLLLLGLGDNAHTASLFPHTSIIQETAATVVSLYVSDEDEFRISMSAPLINQARQVSVLAFGSAKASAVHQVIEGEWDPVNYPAQLIRPASNPVDWFLDEQAAALLSNPIR
ncbi:MAG: 6-phosphogluconolactonase [Saprospiraceae bacterium]|nr:6-phosphogluconolactonase [Saprospiraceae bacterium]